MIICYLFISIVLIAALSLALILLITHFKEKSNYKKAKRMIVAAEKHLKEKDDISSYSYLKNYDEKIVMITRRKNGITEVLIPKNSSQILNLINSKRILKKFSVTKTLPKKDFLKIATNLSF